MPLEMNLRSEFPWTREESNGLASPGGPLLGLGEVAFRKSRKAAASHECHVCATSARLAQHFLSPPTFEVTI